MKRAFQQGHADGLCGLYSIVNFLHRYPGTNWSDQVETLWYLFEACRQFGWLTPQYLSYGFEEFQLKPILDLQITNYRIPYSTYYVKDVSQSYGYKKFSELADTMIARNGAIIASASKKNHWVLVMSQDGTAIVVDSANANAPTEELRPHQRSLTLDGGLLILPQQRPPVVIDL